MPNPKHEAEDLAYIFKKINEMGRHPPTTKKASSQQPEVIRVRPDPELIREDPIPQPIEQTDNIYRKYETPEKPPPPAPPPPAEQLAPELVDLVTLFFKLPSVEQKKLIMIAKVLLYYANGGK